MTRYRPKPAANAALLAALVLAPSCKSSPQSKAKLSSAPHAVSAKPPLPEGIVGPDRGELRPGSEPLRAAELELAKDLHADWVDDDLAMVWNLRRRLPPEAHAGEWLARLPKAVLEPTRDLGFGARWIDARMPAGYASCSHELLLFHEELVEHHVRCSFERWDALGAALARALGPAFTVELDGTRADAKLSFVVPRAQQSLRSALELALGPQRVVSIPAELAGSYERLSSRSSKLALGNACSEDGSPAPGRTDALSLVHARRFDLLRNVLRGGNPEGRLYAAWVLEAANALEPADQAIAEKLAKLPIEIKTCRGCIFGFEPSGEAAKLLRTE